MAEINPRKSSVDIRYNGKTVTKSFMKKLKSFTYVDVASGESDTISLELENMDKSWLKAWIPQKGDIIKALIYTSNWKAQGEQKTFNCGEFMLDDFNMSGRPMTCTLNAISSPIKTSFSSTQRTVVWENVALEAIVSTIAKKSGLGYVYEGEYLQISSLEQSSQTDSDFLYSLCKKYGLCMKVYSNKIIVFDREVYKAKAAIVSLKEKDLISWSYSSSLEGTYTGGKISYTTTSGDEIDYIWGSSERLLELNEKADSKIDAEKIIKAAINEANHSEVTISTTIVADLRIVASSNANIEGLGRLDGKYHVNRVTHSRAASGYTMELDLSLVK